MLARLKELLRKVIPESVIVATRPLRLFFHPQCRFDRRFGVDTSGMIELDRLAIDTGSWREGAEYIATPPATFRRILRTIRLSYPQFTFIDMGSGKGAVLLYASEFPFKRIIGVEFSSVLHAAAERNIARYRSSSVKSRDVSSVCLDATLYPLPPEPTVFFFANPFKGAVLQTVLGNIERSLQAHPRQILVIYYHPVSRHSLYDRAAFLQRVAARSTYSVYRAGVGSSGHP